MIDEEAGRREAAREGVGGGIWKGRRGFKSKEKKIIYFN